MDQWELTRHARDWRVEQGITQKQVAEAMGTTQSEISRIESGSSGFTMVLFIDYIEAMGLELSIGVME